MAGPTKRAPSSGAGAGAGSTPGDASREEILRAAAELFMAAGYAATSIDAMARRLGATKGRIYHHYRSKSDLYLEVQLAAMRRLDDAVGAIARGPGRPEERLAAMALRHVSILLTELPLLSRPTAVAEAGFTAAEFWWPFPVAVPTDHEVDAFAGAVQDAGLQLSGLNFFAGDMPAGDRGVLSNPERSGEFRDNLDVITRIGEQLGTPAFNALYGKRIDGVTPEEQDALAA